MEWYLMGKEEIMVYLITGKAGAGKSTYAENLAAELDSEGKRIMLIDADEFRHIHKNNDFSDEGRKRNLFTAAEEAREFEEKGYIVVLAFVSPRKEWRQHMRSMWQESILIYIPGGELWEGTTYETPDEGELQPFYKQDKQYSLFIGRYQPFHNGHEALIRSVLDERKNVCIALRDTVQCLSDPYSFQQRKQMIQEVFSSEMRDGRVVIIKIPDVAEVCYGRRVGWDIREIRLPDDIEDVSATQIREGGR